MTWPQRTVNFVFLRVSMFPKTKSRETSRFEGNKIHCSWREQVEKTKVNLERHAEIPAAISDHVQEQSTFHGKQ